jgi:hypothetical protein
LVDFFRGHALGPINIFSPSLFLLDFFLEDDFVLDFLEGLFLEDDFVLDFLEGLFLEDDFVLDFLEGLFLEEKTRL